MMSAPRKIPGAIMRAPAPADKRWRLVLETTSELVSAPTAGDATQDYYRRRHEHYMSTGESLERLGAVYPYNEESEGR